jgi:hypothetical protein
MHRFFGILIALAVPLAVVGAVALATYHPGPPDAGQDTLNRYLNYLQKIGRPAALVAARPASYPRSFTATLNDRTFGGGSYFSVSDNDATVVTLSGYWYNSASITGSVGMTPVAVFSGYGKPLTYPPQEVWCVQLKPNAASGAQGVPAPGMVLLALHDDAYVDAWIVHELPPGTVTETVKAVGCGNGW